MESEYEPAGPNSYYKYILLDVQINMDSKLLLLEFLVTKDSSGRSRTHDSEILFYDIITQTKTYLTNNEKWEGPAQISPDGNQIALWDITFYEGPCSVSNAYDDNRRR